MKTLPLTKKLYLEDDRESIAAKAVSERVHQLLQPVFDEMAAYGYSMRDLCTVITSEVHAMTSVEHVKKYDWGCDGDCNKNSN